MSKQEAADKVGLTENSVHYYYSKYLNNPKHETPVPGKPTIFAHKSPTQEQINKLIKYIVEDKMSIMEASRKAHIHHYSARVYYKAYLKDPERRIPLQPNRPFYCTQEQISKLIGYIAYDKMTAMDAATRTNMNVSQASCYYNEYLNDPNAKFRYLKLHLLTDLIKVKSMSFLIMF